MSTDIRYQLRYQCGGEDIIIVQPAASDHRLHAPSDYRPPDWARLDHHQCSHCPLNVNEHIWCPVAVNIARAFERVRPGRSYTPVTLDVLTAQRSYHAETTLQRALSSLFGLVCALSNCPHTMPLHPMARFHLPLATDMETFVRALSMMLMRAHLRQQSGAQALTELESLYSNLNLLNRSFARRLGSVSEGEPAANAIVLLDVLARDVSFELADQLPNLRALFDVSEE